MDAIEFVYEWARMCRSAQSCIDCPAYMGSSCGLSDSQVRTKEQAQRLVQLVLDWAAEHPQETRWTKLKKEYPKLKDDAKLSICARDLGYSCPKCNDCEECWDMPVEEEEKE